LSDRKKKSSEEDPKAHPSKIETHFIPFSLLSIEHFL